MRRKKAFDCVEMKWEIQKRIRKQYAGLSPEAARRAKRKAIENDPVLGPFLKRVRVLGSPANR
jgi:hypothetical protein